MKLWVSDEEVEFGPVLTAPGVPGFVGEGHLYQRLIRPALGDIHKGITPAYKTFTLPSREGNMPLREDGLTPRELVPRCVITKWLSGHVLNAVGLSNPGAAFLLDQRRWQKMGEPFFLSFMSAETTPAKRLDEWERFVKLFKRYLPFPPSARFALQANFGCPNVDVDHNELFGEIDEILTIAGELTDEFGIPIVANFSPVAAFDAILRAANHPSCAALWVANTIPWGNDGIDWESIFGTDESPLAKRGFTPGGLSGPACLYLVLECIKRLRAAGVKKPIVGGNGIQSVEAAALVFAAGADAIALGIVGLVRPWRVRRIIRFAHDYYQVQLRRLAA